MYKQFAILFIVAGLAVSIYAITAATDFGLDLREFTGKFIDLLGIYKSVFLFFLGAILSVIGVLGILRERSNKNARAREAGKPGLSGQRAAVKVAGQSGQRAAVKAPGLSGQRAAMKDSSHD